MSHDIEKPHEPTKRVKFTITYDDTGAEAVVAAENEWRLREVIARGYAELGEVPRPGDRVEANGVALEPYFDLHVREFVARRIAPDLHLNIVSNTGGAITTPAETLK